MMRLIAILIITAVSVSGCTSEHEREVEAVKSFINQTTQKDWGDGIPLDALLKAAMLCKSGSYPDECGTVQHQLTDISVSLSSCKSDQRSKLCQAVVRVVGKHPIVTMLPASKAIPLPSDPWYLTLPTDMLEVASWKGNYRAETIFWWYQKWDMQILICIGLLVLGYGTWFWWSDRNETKKARIAALARQRAAHEKQERVSRTRKYQARVEAEQQAELEQAAAQAELNRKTAEKIAQQQDAEARAKLAAERAEVKHLLEIAFHTPLKSKRRKNVPSSQ